jgi:hypothetical protein
MRSSLRVLTVGILLAALLVVPAVGAAGAPQDPQAEPGTGLQVTLPGGPTVVPAQVPGATVGALGLSDPYAYSYSAGATVVTVWSGSAYYEYNSVATGPILASLGLPAGATLWQIDYYGCTTGATTQAWALYDENVTTGTQTSPGFVTTSAGPGVVHATNTFSSGLTLAAGHEWNVDLSASSATSGFVGVVFQYTLATLSFVPITPTRVLDTRTGTGGLSGPFTNHAAQTFQVTGGSSGVPIGAKAVTGNLTVTGQTSNGYLYIGPVAMNDPTSSTLNFPAGDDRANGVTVALGAGGTLSITFVAPTSGPTAHAIFDVTGYYQ